ncbi:MAG: TrbI/VirB10 family protein [Vicinamibacterales bacterium]
MQTWLLAGLAAFMLLIMFVVGRPDAPPRAVVPAGVPPGIPSAERVRDYQDRLRSLEAQAAAQAPEPPIRPATANPRDADARAGTTPADPLEGERRRRDYESLFSSNVVLSRRPEPERPDGGGRSADPQDSRQETAEASIDDIADAAVRATTRASVGTGVTRAPLSVASAVSGTASESLGTSGSAPSSRAATRTPPISAAGPLHRLLEGTVIDAVLANRLDGSSAAPVNCLVTNAVYSHSGHAVLIPAGARVLGETKPVQTFGETRLAVTFHRLLLPNGETYGLDQFLGLNQIGDAGLKDKVNQHYLATFGAAAAVGLIGGLSQYLGSAGLSGGDGSGDRTVIIAGGVGESTSQAALQVMNRFLNRLPTVTIREGHRVKVYLTSDLELPIYNPSTDRSF